MKKIAINGFGRIGRAAFKVISNTPDMEVVAVNDLLSIENAAYLLKYDTVYGKFEKEVEKGENHLLVGGKHIQYTSIKDPAELPWKALDVNVVIVSMDGIENGLFDAHPSSQDLYEWTYVVRGTTGTGKDGSHSVLGIDAMHHRRGIHTLGGTGNHHCCSPGSDVFFSILPFCKKPSAFDHHIDTQ